MCNLIGTGPISFIGRQQALKKFVPNRGGSPPAAFLFFRRLMPANGLGGSAWQLCVGGVRPARGSFFEFIFKPKSLHDRSDPVRAVRVPDLIWRDDVGLSAPGGVGSNDDVDVAWA